MNRISMRETMSFCTVTRLCKDLQAATQPEHGTISGFYLVRGYMVPSSPGALDRLVGVRVRVNKLTGVDVDRLISYCPWCGADLRFDERMKP
jgi:hypothetical protein